MEIYDYNGEGRWTREEILERYARFAVTMGIPPRDLSPREHVEDRHGRSRHWVYPVMDEVIEGIVAGDAACVRIGIEFIEEDARFPFGKSLKSQTARALRRYAVLSDEQKTRIRRRVFAMLAAGHVPREYRDYARLVRRIGFRASDIPEVDQANPYVQRFHAYFKAAASDDR